MRNNFIAGAIIVLVAILTFSCGSKNEVNITLLSTSDIHGRIFPWDYAINEEDKNAGLLKVSSIVKEVRAETDNVVLIDSGDTTQDNSIELFMAQEPSPIIEVMNDIGYDVWTVGNHEFNFGLDYLDRSIAGIQSNVVVGNIYDTATNTRKYDAYTIMEVAGVKIALIGMVTPNIPRWEASTPANYAGLKFTDPVEELTKIIDEIGDSADVLVGVFHLGLDPEYSGTDGVRPMIEANPTLDVAMIGHAHSSIAGEMIGDTLVVEPGAYGAYVSRIDLTLENKDGDWSVVEKASSNIDTTDYEADEELAQKYAYVHEESIADANAVIGSIEQDFIKDTTVTKGIPTIQVEDTALIDFINEVQKFYAKTDVSSAAAFKTDMNLLAGDFTKKDVVNIYKYPNTLIGVEITGKQLKEYMEWSAAYYNQFQEGDLTLSFNPEIRGYNYDMFDGVDYKIDVSQEAGKRIVDLTFNGEPISDDMKISVAVNNYRFGAMLNEGIFNEEDKIYDSALEYADGSIRTLIIKYIQEQKNGVVTPVVDNNWEVIGMNIDPNVQQEVYALIENGEISIPVSEDGRTPNISSLNAYALAKDGIISLEGTSYEQ